MFLPVFTSGFDPSVYNFEIFNRWGELIFVTKNFETGWDGTYHNSIAQDGAYTWKISFKDLYTAKNYEINGSLTLIK